MLQEELELEVTPGRTRTWDQVGSEMGENKSKDRKEQHVHLHLFWAVIQGKDDEDQAQLQSEIKLLTS